MESSIHSEPPAPTRSVKDYINSPAELIAAIRGAAQAIWDKYWSIQGTRRQETLDQLEALKWKPFYEIGRSNQAYTNGRLLCPSYFFYVLCAFAVQSDSV